MARRRARVPLLSRMTWWVGVGVVSVLGGAPEAALPGLVVFETLLAPRLTRRPRRPLGPLAAWRPPESWRASPEAPAHTRGRP